MTATTTVYLFAHLAAGLLAALAWNRFAPRRRLDPLLGILGGILPDLIDKPLSLLIPEWDNHTRGIAHTLLFLGLLVLACLRAPKVAAVALGVATHHVLDVPWTYARTFLWPFLGPRLHTGGDFAWDTIRLHLENTVTILGEVAGAILLLVYVGLEWRRRTQDAAARS